MIEQVVSANGEPRMLALSRVTSHAGFNPRGARDAKKFSQLVASVKADGVLQPILVVPEGEDFRIVAGERRYLAAAEAGCTEIPAFVRDAGEQADALVWALAENGAREDLDPVDEALGFQRLLDAGLTRKGIAERLGVSPKLVTERLAILELPEQLFPRIADGEIPPGAIRSLVSLVRIHPDLPVVLAARVGVERSGYYAETLTWADVIDDPITALTGDSDDEPPLPDGVYEAGESYPVSAFTLTDEATEALVELCEADGRGIEDTEVRFGRESLEQAAALNAVHASADGNYHLIVGREVADQLVSDQVVAILKQRRSYEKALARESKPAASGEDTGKPEDELAARRAKRAAELKEREVAQGYNGELGAAVLKSLSRLKVDVDVLRVLAAIDVSDLGGLAMRGARYGFPGWPVEEQRKNGTIKVTYLDRAGCETKVAEFLDGASTPGDVAGRLFCLIAMAVLADEQATAMSSRSYYHLKVADRLPWGQDVGALIERICVDRLPAHLVKREKKGKRVAKAA